VLFRTILAETRVTTRNDGHARNGAEANTAVWCGFACIFLGIRIKGRHRRRHEANASWQCAKHTAGRNDDDNERNVHATNRGPILVVLGSRRVCSMDTSQERSKRVTGVQRRPVPINSLHNVAQHVCVSMGLSVWPRRRKGVSVKVGTIHTRDRFQKTT
jgi:hypothetical protein